MKISIEGVFIELTKEQLKYIKDEKARRLKENNSFRKILLHHGFKKDESGYSHSVFNWWADIIDHGTWKEVWMVGNGLKAIKSFPGGYHYGTPKEIDEEICKYLQNNNQH